jgi:hypothetical protein
MAEQKGGKVAVISAAKLDWRKGSEYRDKFSEVMSLIGGDRSIIIDFGVLDEEGKKMTKGGLEPINPYIEHHTRIRVSPEHFVAMMRVLNDHLEKRMKEKKEKE